MAQLTISQGTTHTIRVEAFHDARDPGNLADPDNPTVFLDAATIAEAQVTDVSDKANPVDIGGPITLIPDGSGGKYGADLPHDFESSALVAGMRIEIVSTLEEGPVHWETPHEERLHLIE